MRVLIGAFIGLVMSVPLLAGEMCPVRSTGPAMLGLEIVDGKEWWLSDWDLRKAGGIMVWVLDTDGPHQVTFACRYPDGWQIYRTASVSGRECRVFRFSDLSCR